MNERRFNALLQELIDVAEIDPLVLEAAGVERIPLRNLSKT